MSLAFTFRQTTTKVVQGAFVFVPAITSASTVLLYDIHISIVPKRRLSTENLIKNPRPKTDIINKYDLSTQPLNAKSPHIIIPTKA